MTTFSEYLTESTLMGSKVNDVLLKNKKKTKKLGGNVEVLILRQSRVTAFKGKDAFIATRGKDGSWKPHGAGLAGEPAKVTGGKKKFSDEVAAKALETLFK